MIEIVITAVGASLVAVIGNIILFKMQRNANKEDKEEKKLKDRVEKIEKENKEQNRNYELIHESLLALLKDRLFQSCKFYISKGDISVEELENLTTVYKAYSSLGGNGTGKKLYESTQKLFEKSVIEKAN